MPRVLLDQRRPAVFRPADPPREGRLVLYGEGPDEIELAGLREQQAATDPDGQWYRLTRAGTGWDPDSAPAPDPAALLTPGPS